MAQDAAELTVLLERAAAGDRAAFGQLYDSTSAKLFGVALRITRDRGRAEEALQEAYVKIWRNAGRFDSGRSSPITWMATIARNTAIDSIRRHSKETTASDDALLNIADDAPTQEATMMSKEARRDLNICLETLEPQHRDVVRLAYLEGLSRQELAERFSTPVGTIKSWLRRSLIKLKECLDG